MFRFEERAMKQSKVPIKQEIMKMINN